MHELHQTHQTQQTQQALPPHPPRPLKSTNKPKSKNKAKLETSKKQGKSIELYQTQIHTNSSTNCSNLSNTSRTDTSSSCLLTSKSDALKINDLPKDVKDIRDAKD